MSKNFFKIIVMILAVLHLDMMNLNFTKQAFADSAKENYEKQFEDAKNNEEFDEGALAEAQSEFGDDMRYGDEINEEGNQGKEYKTTYLMGNIIFPITFIASIVVAALFAKKCPEQPSSWIIMLAGIVGLAGEIANWVGLKRQKAAIERKIEGLSNVSAAAIEVQVLSINESISMLNAGIKAAKIRKGIVIAATVIYFAAAVTALIEYICDIAPGCIWDSSCKSGSFNASHEAKAGVSGAGMKGVGAAGGTAAAGGVGALSGMEKTLGKIGIVVAFAVAITLALVMVLNKSSTKLATKNGLLRAIVAALFGGIGLGAVKTISNQIKTLESRKEQFENLKTMLVERTETPDDGGLPSGGLGGGSTGGGNGLPPAGTDGLGDNPMETGQCFDANNKNILDSNMVPCDSCGAGGCKTPKIAELPASIGNIALPGAVTSSFNDAKKGLNELSKKGSLRGLSNSAGNLNAVRRALKNTEKTLLGAMKDNNMELPKQSVLAMAGKEMASVFKTARDELNKLSDDQKRELASSLSSPLSDGDPSKAPKDYWSDMLGKMKKDAPASFQRAITIDDSFDDEDEMVSDEGDGLTDSLAKYGVKADDIVKAPERSIFDVLTRRYKLSAYPQFFKAKTKQKGEANASPVKE